MISILQKDNFKQIILKVQLTIKGSQKLNNMNVVYLSDVFYYSRRFCQELSLVVSVGVISVCMHVHVSAHMCVVSSVHFITIMRICLLLLHFQSVIIKPLPGLEFCLILEEDGHFELISVGQKGGHLTHVTIHLKVTSFFSLLIHEKEFRPKRLVYKEDL